MKKAPSREEAVPFSKGNGIDKTNVPRWSNI